jgi:uncharacterized protein YeaO (DUF488 family)
MIRCKRVYEPIAPDDGQRVLVDRLWPRGCTKDSLALTSWLRDAGPSTELRQRFHKDPTQFDEFRRLYRQQLAGHPEYWQALLAPARDGCLTLLFAASDLQQNNAQVLAEFLEDELERSGPPSSPVCYAGEL